MKTALSLLLLFLTGLIICQAQYSPAEPESLNLKDYSQTEIRQLLLDTDKSTEPYQLARKSRWNNICRITFYTVGAIYIISGLSGLNNLANDDNEHGTATGTAVVGLGVGAAGISLGIWQSRKSEKRLQRALELYQEK